MRARRHRRVQPQPPPVPSEARDAAAAELAPIIDRLRVLDVAAKAARARLEPARAALAAASAGRAAAELNVNRRRAAGAQSLDGVNAALSTALATESEARVTLESIEVEIRNAAIEAATISVRRFELVEILNPRPS